MANEIKTKIDSGYQLLIFDTHAKLLELSHGRTDSIYYVKLDESFSPAKPVSYLWDNSTNSFTILSQVATDLLFYDDDKQFPTIGNVDSLYYNSKNNFVYYWSTTANSYIFLCLSSSLVIQLITGTSVVYTHESAVPEGIDVSTRYTVGFDGKTTYLQSSFSRTDLDANKILILFSPTGNRTWDDIFNNYVPPEVPAINNEFMYRAMFDFNNNGRVDLADDSSRLGGQTASYYTGLIGDLNGLQTNNKTSLVDAVNENASQLVDISTNIKIFGAKGDGITDDTQAFKQAFSSGVKSIYIPSGIYIINMTAGTDHSLRNFFTSNVYKITGVKNKSVIKLGNGNCNEATYTGFQAIFWFGGADVDVEIDGITFDYNVSQNPVYHYSSQYYGDSANELNGQLFVVCAYQIRDLSIKNCTIIGHSGTNAVLYRPNTNNTRDAKITIAYNIFEQIGTPSHYNNNGTVVDAYHDCSTLAIHNADATNYNHKTYSYIYDNIFKGIGGNAYNTCECGTDEQLFYNNYIEGYFIGNLILCSRRDVVSRNYNNTVINAQIGSIVWTYNNETVTPSEFAFKYVEIKNNKYYLNPEYYKNTPNWTEHVINSNGYYDHFYAGMKWGYIYRNIDTLNIDNNLFEYINSPSITSIGSSIYTGLGLSFGSTFNTTDIPSFSAAPLLKNLIITNNTFSNCYKNALSYTTYPNTTNITIKGNKSLNCLHDTLITSNQADGILYDITLCGDGSGSPYAINSAMHVYNESVTFEDNQNFNATATNFLRLNFWEKVFNVQNSIFKYRNNTSNIDPVSYIKFVSNASNIANQNISIDAIDSPIKFSATNMINNGGFVSGLTNWTINGGVATTVTGDVANLNNSSANYGNISQAVNFVSGHKYYVRLIAKHTSGTCYIYTSSVANASSSSDLILSLTSSDSILSKKSIIFTATQSASYFAMGRGVSSAFNTDIDSIFIIDLTNAFGSYTPSIEEIEAILKISTSTWTTNKGYIVDNKWSMIYLLNKIGGV